MYALTLGVLLCVALAAAATAFWLTAVNPCVAAGQVLASGRALVIRPEHRACGGSRWGLHLQESATPHISYRMLHVAISRQLRLPGSVGRSYPALVRRPGCCQARCDTVPLPELQHSDLVSGMCCCCMRVATDCLALYIPCTVPQAHRNSAGNHVAGLIFAGLSVEFAC